MSRRLLAFLLSELKTVRVICPRKECGAVSEVSIDGLGVRFADRLPACPLCKHEFVGVHTKTGYQDNAFVRLAEAIREFQGAGQMKAPDVQIEFVLPDPTAE